MAVAGGKDSNCLAPAVNAIAYDITCCTVTWLFHFFFCGQVAVGDCVILPPTSGLTMPPVRKADASSVIGKGKPNMAAMIFFKQYFRC